jgi:putative transposase
VPAFERREVSMTRACVLLGVSRRRVKYASKRIAKDQALVARMRELAQKHPRAGARQLRRLLKREGTGVNLKRVRRLCKRHGLLLKQKRRRKRLGIGVGMPCRAERPGHVWAYDFVEDRTETGRKLRILTVVDEFTRRCIEVEVEHKMNAKFVARTLLRLFQVHGTPTFIRSDNGPEFVAKFLMRVMRIHGVSARHIDPGSPWQNGKNERFNGTLRDECLNPETFHHRDHARAIVKLFKKHYNDERPHSSLGTKANWAVTPSEFYDQWKQKNQEKEGKDGCAGGGEMDLSLCAPRAVGLAKDEPIDAEALPSLIDRPDSPAAIHVGARVASQQSSILRVDEQSLPEPPKAGTFPARNQQPAPET